MEPRTATLTASADEWAEVERWSLRAQALAELRVLGWRDQEREAAGARSDQHRTIVLP